MLAYRHAFHAGNHADVLKHVVLMQLLKYLGAKDKPFRFVDTHAGAGGYLLKGHQAQKKGEYREGIGRLWSRADLPEAVADYVSLLHEINRAPPPMHAEAHDDGDATHTAGAADSHDAADATDAIADAHAAPPAQAPAQIEPRPPSAADKGMTPKLAHYPGSPEIARHLMRRGDQLRLFELHSTDARILSAACEGDRRVQVYNDDGFAGHKGQVPPTPRRALILMDPSYEIVSDYTKLVVSLRDAVTRFAEGVYMVWYPQVNRLESAQLARRLTAMAPKGWLHARLTVQPLDSKGFGLGGSGVVVINPPYTLQKTLAEVMPFLVEALAQFDGASYLLEEQPA